jgi:hypothetical protein
MVQETRMEMVRTGNNKAHRTAQVLRETAAVATAIAESIFA